MLTFAVGFGEDYEPKTLQNIVSAGNAKTNWMNLFFQENKASKNFIIKIGKENLSLLIKCSDPNSLIAQFKRFAFAMSGLNESLLLI